jgi:hypothetical protein
LACLPYFFSYGPLGMMYEFLWDCLVLDNSTNGFNFYFEICGHISQGHVSPSISHLLSAFWFISLEKQFQSICFIVINEVTYHLVARTLTIQFKDTFV